MFKYLQIKPSFNLELIWCGLLCGIYQDKAIGEESLSLSGRIILQLNFVVIQKTTTFAE